MKAFVQDSYGPPSVLRLTEVETPVPGDDEVLVRVLATSINPYDWHSMRGEPRIARIMPGGLGLSPKIRTLGCDVAGRVEEVGKEVRDVRVGDDVLALVAGGGFGEFVCVPEDLLVPKPARASYEDAAALPMAAVTALLALGDGELTGQEVLVNGASGGVGTFAVQLAHTFGARVTGVCSAGNAELVRSIGAEATIDHTQEDFTHASGRYDLIVDCAGGRSVAAMRKALRPGGALMAVGGPAGRWVQPAGRMIAAMAMSRSASRRVLTVDTVSAPDKKELLRKVTDLVEADRIRPVIDSHYGFEEIPDAVAHQEAGHARGKVVVTVARS